LDAPDDLSRAATWVTEGLERWGAFDKVFAAADVSAAEPLLAAEHVVPGTTLTTALEILLFQLKVCPA